MKYLLAVIVATAAATRPPNNSIAFERAIVRLFDLQRLVPEKQRSSWDTVHIIQDLLPLLVREPARHTLPALIRLQSYRFREPLALDIQCWIIRTAQAPGAPSFMRVSPSACLAEGLGVDERCEDEAIYVRLMEEAIRNVKQRDRCELTE